MLDAARAVGRRKRLSVSRRIVCDLLHFASKTPHCPIERSLDLGSLAAAREAAAERIGWAAIFLKAYGLVAARQPALRQAWLAWPWAHLYEHPLSVAMLAIQRERGGESELYFGRFLAPENQSLVEIQQAIDGYKHGPVEQVFRKQLRLANLPTPIRRILWWCNLNLSGSARARRLGTFGMSTLAAAGAINRQHPSCLSTSLTYGPLDEDGRMLVTILYDHRLVDGEPMCRVLRDLEAVLRGELADELRGLCERAQAA